MTDPLLQLDMRFEMSGLSIGVFLPLIVKFAIPVAARKKLSYFGFAPPIPLQR